MWEDSRGVAWRGVAWRRVASRGVAHQPRRATLAFRQFQRYMKNYCTVKLNSDHASEIAIFSLVHLFRNNRWVRVRVHHKSGVDTYSSLNNNTTTFFLTTTTQIHTMSDNASRIERHKLNSEITDQRVIHRSIESDLGSRRRRIEVVTTWLHERSLGSGAHGQVLLQRESESGQLRAVKVIARNQLGALGVRELKALIDVQDVCMALE